MEIEQEANAEEGVVDYALNEDLEQLNEECDEHAEITIVHEVRSAPPVSRRACTDSLRRNLAAALRL